MIYDYACVVCEETREAIRQVKQRNDDLECECGSNMTLLISGGAGFKISGSGVASPGYKHNGAAKKYKRGRPVGPLSKDSKAYEKNQDDKSSKYYGPGQGSWLAQDTDRRNEHNKIKDTHGL